MGSMTDKIRGILSDLWYQHPTGVTTMGPCATGCGNSSRGSRVCKDCLEKELLEAGCKPADVAYLMLAHHALQQAVWGVADAEKELMK
jgi:hypothetical protein